MLIEMYGRTFDSPWEIPGARPGHGRVDVTIREGLDADIGGEPSGHPTGWFAWDRRADGSDLVRWEGMFEFLISPDGREIVGHQLGVVHPETLAVYLLNHVVSFSLIKLGDEPVHATVVAMRGDAIAMCGPPGAGKSTLATALLAAGGTLVTDDLMVVRWMRDVPYAQLGAPRIKLSPATSDRMLPGPSEGVALNPNTHKRIVPLPTTQVADAASPVRLLVFLRPPREGGVVVRTVSQRRAMLDLVGNTFNPVVTTPDRMQTQFATDVRLAGAVAAVSVTSPHRWEALGTVVERLMDRLRAASGPLLG